jgi:RNA polymerase sigma-70 factor (ECF subfamily)
MIENKNEIGPWKRRWNLMDDWEAKRDRVLKEALGYRVELMAYARALLGNYTAAEDAVQEAMLVVVKKFDQFQEGTSMPAWCRAILRLEVLRMKQQWHREQTLAERLLDDAVDAAFDEFQTVRRRDDAESWRQALERCLRRVPERGRRVLKSRFADELSYREIGERVGMTLEAVRKALFRLKKQVRSCVEISQRSAQ